MQSAASFFYSALLSTAHSVLQYVGRSRRCEPLRFVQHRYLLSCSRRLGTRRATVSSLKARRARLLSLWRLRSHVSWRRRAARTAAADLASCAWFVHWFPWWLEQLRVAGLSAVCWLLGSAVGASLLFACVIGPASACPRPACVRRLPNCQSWKQLSLMSSHPTAEGPAAYGGLPSGKLV